MSRIHTIKAAAITGLLITALLSACSEQPSEPESVQADDLVHFTETEPQGDSSKPSAPEPTDAVELPADWPSDVELAPYMLCKSVTRVRDDFMVSFHAPDKALTEFVDWFTSMLTANGWSSDGDSINDRGAILAYSKDNRRCGITVTNFILDASMQRDDTTLGITIQTKAQP